MAAQIDGTRVSATLPDGATVYFLNVTDERGLLVSSQHEYGGEHGREE